MNILDIIGFYCLSICQPYTELILSGLKKYETRNYKTNYRGIVFLHSGLKKWRYENKNISVSGTLLKGFILGYGYITDCIPITQEFINSLPENEKQYGLYTVGRYAWKIENVKRIQPIPYKGKMRLFKIK